MPGLFSNAQRHLIGGVVLSLATFVLLLLCTFSVPFIKTIYFLRAPTISPSGGTLNISYGAYGWCSQADGQGGRDYFGPVLGYRWDPQLIFWLTKGMITIGIACALSLFALIALLLEIFCRPSYQLTNPIWFRLFSGLTALTTIIAFVFTTVLFHNARIRFENAGIDAQYGPAEWMLLAAMILGFLSLCVGGPRFTGRHMYRADNRAAYNV